MKSWILNLDFRWVNFFQNAKFKQKIFEWALCRSNPSKSRLLGSFFNTIRKFWPKYIYYFYNFLFYYFSPREVALVTYFFNEAVTVFLLLFFDEVSQPRADQGCATLYVLGNIFYLHVRPPHSLTSPGVSSWKILPFGVINLKKSMLIRQRIS